MRNLDMCGSMHRVAIDAAPAEAKMAWKSAPSRFSPSPEPAMLELPPLSIAEVERELSMGRVTSREFTEVALAEIAEPHDEGPATFLHVLAESARAEADAADAWRRAGRALPPLAGMILSVKDLFDIAGLPTTCGSKILWNAEPARKDATIVARLRAAGAVIIGRTNMTEFAYSGIGINPHFGTPRNRWRKSEHRVPGGSSSGAAVAVAENMCFASVGTDTGGSIRIPAAWNCLVGFKPSRGRVPTDGSFPLSPTLDTVGPIARTVADCRLIDQVMAGLPVGPGRERRFEGLRLGVLRTLVHDLIDPIVSNRFEQVVRKLSAKGAHVVDVVVPAVERVKEINALGSIGGAEAYHVHRNFLADADIAAAYDPRVRMRLERGRSISAADFIEMHAIRDAMAHAADAATHGFDAILAPTVAILPPRLGDLASDEKFSANNILALRNTMAFNLLDRPAITLPLHLVGDEPVGMMVVGATGADADLLDVAEAVERVVVER